MTEKMPRTPNEKVPRWQAEVEEILEQSDRDPTSFEKARAAALATRYKAPDRARAATERASTRVGDGIWLIAAIALGVAAWIAGIHWPLAGRILADCQHPSLRGILRQRVASISQSKRRAKALARSGSRTGRRTALMANRRPSFTRRRRRPTTCRFRPLGRHWTNER